MFSELVAMCGILVAVELTVLVGFVLDDEEPRDDLPFTFLSLL